jgi:CRP/FNR family transcriptional regulator, anaerobic regulatory protein
VRPLAVCGVLTREQTPCLAAIARGAQLDAGETLFYEDDPAAEVFTVTSGMLKLSKLLPDGRRQITGFLTPGDYLGLAFAARYVYSAEAVTPVRICRFSRQAFLGLLEQFPALEKALFGRAATELAAAQQQMLLLGRKTARERVASFFLQLAERQGPDDGTLVDLPMTRTDIADYLGLTIETVSRNIAGLRKAGLIALPDLHHLRILHRRRLATESGG